MFAPNPDLILKQIRRGNDEEQTMTDDDKSSTLKSESSQTRKEKNQPTNSGDSNLGYVIVSGDFDGDIKVFYNFNKPKHSSLPLSAK